MIKFQNDLVEGIGQVVTRDPSKLPQGILSRVSYPIMRIGLKNKNNRVYNESVARKVLNDPEIKERIFNRNLFGNSEHPLETALKLSKEHTSHIVSSLYLKENTLYADLDILPTESGEFIDILLEAGCKVGTSTRANGDLEECIDESGAKYFNVIPDLYQFVTIDFTGDPSTLKSLPEQVQKNIASIVKTRMESKQVEKETAVALLESMNVGEAKQILEEIKKPVCEERKGDKKDESFEDINSKIIDLEVKEACSRAELEKIRSKKKKIVESSLFKDELKEKRKEVYDLVKGNYEYSAGERLPIYLSSNSILGDIDYDTEEFTDEEIFELEDAAEDALIDLGYTYMGRSDSLNSLGYEYDTYGKNAMADVWDIEEEEEEEDRSDFLDVDFYGIGRKEKRDKEEEKNQGKIEAEIKRWYQEAEEVYGSREIKEEETNESKGYVPDRKLFFVSVSGEEIPKVFSSNEDRLDWLYNQRYDPDDKENIYMYDLLVSQVKEDRDIEAIRNREMDWILDRKLFNESRAINFLKKENNDLSKKLEEIQKVNVNLKRAINFLREDYNSKENWGVYNNEISFERAIEISGDKNPSYKVSRQFPEKLTIQEREVVIKNIKREIEWMKQHIKELISWIKGASVSDKSFYIDKKNTETKLLQDKEQLLKRIVALQEKAKAEEDEEVKESLDKKSSEIMSLEEQVSILKKNESKLLEQIKELNSSLLKLKEESASIATGLSENHQKDLISSYVSGRLTHLGLELPTHLIMILESCSSKQEVENLLQKFRNDLRESKRYSPVNGEVKVPVAQIVDPNIVAIEKSVTNAFLGIFGER